MITYFSDLFNGSDYDCCDFFCISEIKQLVAQVPPVNFEEVKKLERKLDHCLNEEFDPESEM